MRVRSLLAAAAALTISASTASAAFQVTTTRSAGTGDLAGFDIVRFFGHLGAEEVAAGAVGLQSAKVTLVSLDAGTLKIPYTVLNSHPNSTTPNDADIYGTALTDDLAHTQQDDNNSGMGTQITVRDPDGDLWSVQGLFISTETRHPIDPNSAYTSLPVSRNLSSASSNPLQVFANLKSLRVEGFVPNPAPPGVGADPRAGTDSLGALFAIAVVPTNGTVRGFGSLSPDRGSLSTFDVFDPPSPSPPPSASSAWRASLSAGVVAGPDSPRSPHTQPFDDIHADWDRKERAKGVEPSTSGLESLHSAN